MRKSFWLAEGDRVEFPQLKDRVEADVAVIGAGMTGLTAALLLKRAGKRVVVIDRQPIGHGESGHTTAHITEMLDTRYQTLINRFGKDGARAAAESSRSAIDRIESFVRELEIDCGFERVPGFLYTESRLRTRMVRKELESARAVGSDAVWTEQVPLPFATRGALRVGRQAQFHPYRYMKALASAVEGDGSQIFANTHAVEMKDGNPCRIATESGGTIVARDIIVATDSPNANRFLLITKVEPYRTYVIAVDLEPGTEPASGLYWDTADPYHYIRNSSDGVWIIGGEDHKVGMKEDTEQCFRNLEAYTRQHFKVRTVLNRWSGQILDPIDGLPYIGKDPLSSHTYVATGYSGNGMTFGTLAGMILSDQILEVANSWSELYKPGRIRPLASAGKFISYNKDFPVCIMKDRVLQQTDAKSFNEISPGEGRTVQWNGKSVAAYRHPDGKLECVSAVCTHMACNVRWNNSEKSWDCPCHGSRFERDGRVLHGPATRPLAEIQVTEAEPEEIREVVPEGIPEVA